MTKPFIRIVEIDGSVIDREMTDAEYEQHLADIAQFEASKSAYAELAAKRASALNKLEALGLDEDDLTALGIL